MVRTLTLLSLLTLAAGLAVGLFAGQVFGLRFGGQKPAVDPNLQAKVHEYVERYRLDDAQTEQVQQILRDYDQDLLQLFRVLRVKHHDEFKAVSDRANARMTAVLPGQK